MRLTRIPIALRRNFLLAFLIALIPFPGCDGLGGDPRVGKIQRGINFAKARFSEIGRNPMATAAFGSQVEMGGDYVTYLAACMDENAEYPLYCMNAPKQAWCVVLRQGPNGDEIFIEGYGEDLTKPIQTAMVTFAPFRPRE